LYLIPNNATVMACHIILRRLDSRSSVTFPITE
jgi:hypothetical protein